MRAYWIVAVVAAAPLGFGIYKLVVWPGFEPHGVRVVGTAVVSRSQILEAAAIDPHRNVWLADWVAARDRVEAIPYVDVARINVFPPASVTILVIEREPSDCVVATDGTRGTIDTRGRVLEAGCARKQSPALRPADIATIPPPGSFLHAAKFEELKHAAEALARSQAFVSFADDEFGGVLATRSDGIIVRFGDADQLAQKAALVEPILDTVRGRLGTIKAVDVRVPATPVVEYR